MKNYISDSLLFGKHKINIDLKGVPVAINSGDNVYFDDSVRIVVDLFTIEELFRYENLSEKHLDEIAEYVVREKLIEVVSSYGKEINFEYSGAGLCRHICKCIHYKSLEVIKDLENIYDTYYSNVTLIESLCAVISKYLSIPYTEVVRYPIHEVIRLHSVCAKSFPDVLSLVDKHNEAPPVQDDDDDMPQRPPRRR